MGPAGAFSDKAVSAPAVRIWRGNGRVAFGEVFRGKGIAIDNPVRSDVVEVTGLPITCVFT